MFLKNKVTLALLLTLNCQFFIPLMYSSNNQDIYPFNNDPNTSWREFEKDFREKYQSLDIPPIHLVQNTTTRLNGSSTAYIGKYATNHPDWPNLKAQLAISSQPPLILVDTPQITSSDYTGWGLLHEIGQHYYDDQRNTSTIKSVIINASTNLSVLCKNADHCYHNILNQPFTVEQVVAQVLLVGLLGLTHKALNPLIQNFMIHRPAIYFADQVANQIATAAMLKAAQHKFSLQGCIEDMVDKRNLRKDLAKMHSKDQQQFMHNLTSQHSVWYSLSDKIDITPCPSEKKRHDLIQKALQDRFGITK